MNTEKENPKIKPLRLESRDDNGRKVTTTVEEWNGLPRLTHVYGARPSWRRYGDGTRRVEFTISHGGGLSINAEEIPQGERGAKEVYVGLNREAKNELARLLVPNLTDLILIADHLTTLDETEVFYNNSSVRKLVEWAKKARAK